LFRRGNPVLQQRIGDGQYHRPQEQAKHAEGQQAADDTGQDEQQRKVGTVADQDGTQDIVHHERRYTEGNKDDSGQSRP